MTDQHKKLLLFCKKGLLEEDLTGDEMVQVSVYGAVVVLHDEEPCQEFIDAADVEGIQLMSYAYYPEQENPDQWEPILFTRGKQLADKLNNLIMANYN